MNKNYLLISAVLISIVMMAYNFSEVIAKPSSTVLTNLRALDEGIAQNDSTEAAPCDYKNGYTSFTSRKGGAYDCCQVWVPYSPGGEHCR